MKKAYVFWHVFKMQPHENEVVATFVSSDPSRSVKVIVQEGLQASGDAALVKVLLDNLFGNAWKFTGNEEFPNIEFGQRYEEKGGGRFFYFGQWRGIRYGLCGQTL